MAMDVDLSKLGKLADRVADLARVPSRASKAASDAIATLIEDEFDQGRDPYGKEWAPLAPSTQLRGRTPPPLTDTGAMRSGVQVKPLPGAGVAITIPHPALPHQTGWNGPRSSGPARPILPTRKMPDEWRDAIREAVQETVKGAA